MYIFIHQRINGSTKSTKATLNNLNYSELIVVFRKKKSISFHFYVMSYLQFVLFVALSKHAIDYIFRQLAQLSQGGRAAA